MKIHRSIIERAFHQHPSFISAIQNKIGIEHTDILEADINLHDKYKFFIEKVFSEKELHDIILDMAWLRSSLCAPSHFGHPSNPYYKTQEALTVAQRYVDGEEDASILLAHKQAVQNYGGAAHFVCEAVHSDLKVCRIKAISVFVITDMLYDLNGHNSDELLDLLILHCAKNL